MKSIFISICLLYTLPTLAAATADTGKVITVLGAVAPESLGKTLPHEHIFLDYALPLDRPDKWHSVGAPYPDTPERMALWKQPLDPSIYSKLWYGWPANRDALILDDERLLEKEIREFTSAGGKTIVDLTTEGLSRSPARLAQLARKLDMNIVMGAGWYRDEWMPDRITTHSIDELTKEIIHDITVGFGDTGVRAGIIGEVGVEAHGAEDPLTEREIKVLRASARAALATGAPISLHVVLMPGDPLTVLDILESEKMPLNRVVVGHAHAALVDDMAYLDKILKRGVYIEFDLLGFRESSAVEPLFNDAKVAAGIKELIDMGYEDKILLSHDVYMKAQLKQYGGYGYSYILEHFAPYLKKIGVGEEQITKMVEKNPQRMLTLAKPQMLSDK